jgi:hypothetical protein
MMQGAEHTSCDLFGHLKFHLVGNDINGSKFNFEWHRLIFGGVHPDVHWGSVNLRSTRKKETLFVKSYYIIV